MTLDLNAVTWWFDRGVPIIDGLDLTIAAGEIVAVTGENGCGKTTLLRIAAGALVPRRGVRRTGGLVGYQPQTGDDPPVRLKASVWLDLLAAMKGSAGVDRENVDALRVAPYLDRPLATLSSGTITKVLLLGALLGPPSLLVLDEPFAPLDAPSRDGLAALLRREVARGAGVLISGHDGVPDGLAHRSLDLSRA